MADFSALTFQSGTHFIETGERLIVGDGIISTSGNISITAQSGSINIGSAAATTVNIGFTGGTTNFAGTVTGLTVAVGSVSLTVGSVSLTAQTAAISTTTIYTPTTDSLYTINVYQVCTTGGTAGTLSTTIGYTDDFGVRSVKPTTDISLTTTGNFSQAANSIHAKAGGAITYTTTMAGATGNPQYALFISIVAGATGSSGGNISLIPRGYIDGLSLSSVGPTNVVTIAAGQVAVPAINPIFLITLPAFTKNIATTWAAGTGNGSFFGGLPGTNQWYHVHVIVKADGTADILTGGIIPTLPSGYIYYRRIGSIFFNLSSVITSFVAHGDVFTWLAPVLDVNTVNPGTTAVTSTIFVPPDLPVEARIRSAHFSTTVSVRLWVSALELTDVVPSGTSPGGAYMLSGSGETDVPWRVWTNTNGQIRYRINNSGVDTTVKLFTDGWIDPRGKTN